MFTKNALNNYIFVKHLIIFFLSFFSILNNAAITSTEYRYMDTCAIFF